MRDEDTAN